MGGETQAATLVLRERQLVARIGDFQTGYPHVVAALTMIPNAQLLLNPTQRLDTKILDCILPRLAVVADDTCALRVLFELKLQPSRQHDVKLRFDGMMRLAIRVKSVAALECLLELKASGRDPKWEWEPDLMRLALYANHESFRMIKSIYHYVPEKFRLLQESDIAVFARLGDPQCVQWFASNRYAVSARVLNTAWAAPAEPAQNNPQAFIDAASSGSLDMVRRVTVKHSEDTYRRAMNAAARSGQLHIAQYFVDRGIGVLSPTAIAEAAAGGHLNVVQYLHRRLLGGCTTAAMDAAAKNGNLEIVQFLHENCCEGCTIDALHSAVEHGKLEVVKFLLANYFKGANPETAIQKAADSGHWAVVELFRSNEEGRDHQRSNFAGSHNDESSKHQHMSTGQQEMLASPRETRSNVDAETKPPAVSLSSDATESEQPKPLTPSNTAQSPLRAPPYAAAPEREEKKPAARTSYSMVDEWESAMPTSSRDSLEAECEQSEQKVTATTVEKKSSGTSTLEWFTLDLG
ncbi:hypothetical protein PybrP1_008363 [[Pythium] brassicae (nom. inval.)]|nr:hypothetical protein PybrP1_008363 [[Pythium] brassicae (nom. inval.)]